MYKNELKQIEKALEEHPGSKTETHVVLKDANFDEAAPAFSRYGRYDTDEVTAKQLMDEAMIMVESIKDYSTKLFGETPTCGYDVSIRVNGGRASIDYEVA